MKRLNEEDIERIQELEVDQLNYVIMRMFPNSMVGSHFMCEGVADANLNDMPPSWIISWNVPNINKPTKAEILEAWAVLQPSYERQFSYIPEPEELPAVEKLSIQDLQQEVDSSNSSE
jgi:hypothetical protein|tara:strand:+ start:2701 stop:3054 length:354 start_codon:yes stop_codon:yes gene_type:complete